MRDLVQKPNDFCCRGAMIQIQQHLDSLVHEDKVEVWWDQGMISVDFMEPLSCELHRLVDCNSIEGIGLLEDDIDVIVQKSGVGHEGDGCLA